jgi:hypothetical protein
MKEPFLPAVVANESKSPVPNKTLDRATRHPGSPWEHARAPRLANINICSTVMTLELRRFKAEQPREAGVTYENKYGAVLKHEHRGTWGAGT